jgi:transglutaminase-like putative cysteine protease
MTRVPAGGATPATGRTRARFTGEESVIGLPACHPQRQMIDHAASDALRLKVGCEFGLETSREVEAVMQVAPAPSPGVQLGREAWDTDAAHHGYIDDHGNRCERLTLPRGSSSVTYEAELVLAHPADELEADAAETAVAELPDEVLAYVLPSRFCLPDELGGEAWERFGDLAPGWTRVQAVVDFVHSHLEFLPGSSNPWTTAVDAFRARQGVCRDYAHLAITFCRALNIPARYVFGYLPTIGVPPPAEPMDFAAWFEVYLQGRWRTFDARNNTPRIGRVPVGRGRDAIDVALITSFGAVTLTEFTVVAEAA